METTFTPSRTGIEESPGHHEAYIQLFTQRLEGIFKTKNLGNLEEYLPNNGPKQIGEERDNTPLTKDEFLNHLREAARENPDITGAITDVETSLEEAR